MSCTHEYTRPEDGNSVFMPVTPSKASVLINTKEGMQIIDTRTGWERSGGWIANSVHISFFDFLFGGGYDRVEKDTPVLVYCSHGVRSYRVARSLVKRGWKEVYDLEGGMNAWLKQGYPVVGVKQ